MKALVAAQHEAQLKGGHDSISKAWLHAADVEKAAEWIRRGDMSFLNYRPDTTELMRRRWALDATGFLVEPNSEYAINNHLAVNTASINGDDPHPVYHNTAANATSINGGVPHPVYHNPAVLPSASHNGTNGLDQMRELQAIQGEIMTKEERQLSIMASIDALVQQAFQEKNAEAARRVALEAEVERLQEAKAALEAALEKERGRSEKLKGIMSSAMDEF